MEIRHKNRDQAEVLIITDWDNELSFNLVNEENLSKVFSKKDKGNKMSLYANIVLTASMADFLEAQKIVEVDSVSINHEVGAYEISYHPLFGYSNENMTDVVCEMAKKFSL